MRSIELRRQSLGAGVVTERLLRGRRGVRLTQEDHAILGAALTEVRTIGARTTLVKAGDTLSVSTLLLEGFMCRYLDDSRGLRQLVAVMVPGDFADLHAYPLNTLDHDVATLTPAKIALVHHDVLNGIMEEHPLLGRKLWFSTLLDAAMHRAWLFRVGRLDAIGRVAHLLCEMNARLEAVGLSDGCSFSLGLTQTDLAEACGLTNVHVNRVLRQLREEGLCTFRHGMVEIGNVAALTQRGQFDPSYLYLEKPIG